MCFTWFQGPHKIAKLKTNNIKHILRPRSHSKILRTKFQEVYIKWDTWIRLHLIRLVDVENSGDWLTDSDWTSYAIKSGKIPILLLVYWIFFVNANFIKKHEIIIYLVNYLTTAFRVQNSIDSLYSGDSPKLQHKMRALERSHVMFH